MDFDDTPTREFVRLWTAEQPVVRSYLATLCVQSIDVDDILQDTAVFAWEKFSGYSEGSFRAWACEIAYFKFLEYRRRQQQSRVFLSEEVLALLSETWQGFSASVEPRREALRECVKRLPLRDQELVRMRYAQETTVAELADFFNRTGSAIYKSLARIHAALLRCIKAKVASL